MGRASAVLVLRRLIHASASIIRFAPVATTAALRRMTVHWAVIALAGMALPGAAPADSDLIADWSDTQNPSGPWSYREGTKLLPHVDAWQGWIPQQPAWAYTELGNTRLPSWFRTAATNVGDAQPGDVVVHSTDAVNGVGHGIANLLWTSPVNGVVNVSGAVWMTRDIGRSNHWTLYRNDQALTSGDISSGDPYSRANPFRFDQGSGGPGVLVGIPVAQGDSLELAIAKTSPFGDFVGVSFHITVVGPDTTLAWWRFEEGSGAVAADASGNGNDGTLTGDAGFTDSTPCDLAPGGPSNTHSLALDGSGDAATIPDSPTLRPANAITVECWVRPVNTNGWVVMAKQLGFDCCSNSYSIEIVGGEIHWILSTDETTQATAGATDALPRNAWSHLAGTWDGSTMRLFVNGQQVAERPLGGTIQYDSEAVNVGCDSDGPTGEPGCCWFRGEIDEMRISGVALTPDQFLTCAPTAFPSVSTWGVLFLTTVLLGGGVVSLARRAGGPAIGTGGS